MITEPSTAETYHATLQGIAVPKRFYERWVADPEFRSAVGADPRAARDVYGIDIDPDDIAALAEPGGAERSATARALWTGIHEKARWVERFYGQECVPTDPRIAMWRARQIERQRLDLGPFPTRTNIHASWCAELTKGCTGGCWFCAVSAERLSGVFAHDDDGAALWRGMLDTLVDRLGPAARSGFLYWATDPLDNPDYEAFCLDMLAATGVFPPTTTAFPLKDPDRVRGLIDLAQEHGCWINRFSILSAKMMDRVHAEYSAEELAQVECLSLTKGSAFSFGNAGRFREKAIADPSLLERSRDNLEDAPWYASDPAYLESEDYPLGSIGCVTGFLFNMVDRSVQLISPTTATETWPDGLIVFDQATFEDADDLGRTLDGLVERWMSPMVRPDDVPVLLDFLQYEELDDGFRLEGRFSQDVTFVDPARGAALRATGALVREGRMSAAEIIARIAGDHRTPSAATQGDLDRLLAAGVLSDENGSAS